jgi:hypothetical protein
MGTAGRAGLTDNVLEYAAQVCAVAKAAFGYVVNRRLRRNKPVAASTRTFRMNRRIDSPWYLLKARPVPPA